MLKQFELGEIEAYVSSKIHGAFSVMDMEVLTDYVKRLRPGDQYLEVGVSFGKSAATAVFQSPEGVKFYFVDVIDEPKPENWHLLSRAEFFKQEGIDTVGEFILGDSPEVAKTWNRGELAMIFIDGNHFYEAVKADILGWTPYLKSGGFILFHDYDPSSPGVIQAVNELIQASDKYTDFFTAIDKYRLRSSIAGATKK